MNNGRRQKARRNDHYSETEYLRRDFKREFPEGENHGRHTLPDGNRTDPPYPFRAMIAGGGPFWKALDEFGGRRAQSTHCPRASEAPIHTGQRCASAAGKREA